MPKHTHTHTRACMHMHACIPHVFQCRLQHLFIRLRIPLSQLRLDVHLASSFASPEESALANSIRGAHRNDREETDADEEGKVQLPTLLRERQFTRRFSANRRMLLLIIYTHGATATPCSCICPCSPDFPSAPCRHHRPRPCRTMGCIYEHVHIRVASCSSTPADTSAQPPSCALVVCLPSPHSVFGQVHEPRSTALLPGAKNGRRNEAQTLAVGRPTQCH